MEESESPVQQEQGTIQAGEHDTFMHRRTKRHAPWYSVPDRQIYALEHPFIIQDTDKIKNSLGGNQKIDQAHSSHPAPPLFLRPEDPLNRPIAGQSVRTNNLLLKITAPKRTGRKRKRGSDEPFQPDASHGPSPSPDVLQTLRDKPSNYSIEPLGSIPLTVRYRGLADFQCTTSTSPFTTRALSTLLTPSYPAIKSFHLSPTRGIHAPHDILPPPSLTSQSIPHPYAYAQNPNIKLLPSSTTGKLVLTNTSLGPQLHTILLASTHPPHLIPTAPSPLAPPASHLDPRTAELLKQLHPLFAGRPIWTRRALANTLRQPLTSTALKNALQYVGYMFRSGPWREAVVRFGVDPRASGHYRIYQTLSFQIAAPATNPPASAPHTIRHTHLFSGRPPLALDGKVYQICDITDPLLASAALLGTPNLRQTPDLRSDGWFRNGTMAKARAVMRGKIDALREDGRVLGAVDFAGVLRMPDEFEEAGEAEDEEWDGKRRGRKGFRALVGRRKVRFESDDRGEEDRRVAEVMLQLGRGGELRRGGELARGGELGQGGKLGRRGGAALEDEGEDDVEGEGEDGEDDEDEDEDEDEEADEP